MLCKERIDIIQFYSCVHNAGEHCTNGIDIYINARRIVLLDCQPLLSASIMDRTIQVKRTSKKKGFNDFCLTLQLEKKNTSEFTTIENTMEIHSLQLVGFLFSVCHTVLFVQVENNTNCNKGITKICHLLGLVY